MGLDIRRLVLDVDKAVTRPDLLTLAEAVLAVTGVEALHLSVDEMDLETMGLTLVVEGRSIDYEALLAAIEHSGAVMHSLDEIAAGERLIDGAPRSRGAR